jgi:hypothetical protein
MARGWESKSIESQQDDAQSASVRRPSMTADQRATVQRRQTLELALAGAQAELTAACRAAHQDMIRLKIDALRAELAALAEPVR